MQQTFTASGLIKDGRRYADLENSKFISHDDEVSLLNEAFRDIYSMYTESNGDYFTKDYVFTPTTLDLDPNSLGGGDYLIELPADFYKIRFLSFSSGTIWRPCSNFSASERDNQPTIPKYRLKNNKLWLITNAGFTPQFKLTYYTTPEAVTLPKLPVSFLSSAPIYSLATVMPGVYIESPQVLAYVDGLNIKAENKDTGTTTTLYASASAPSNLVYYAGYLYWIAAGIAYRAPTDFLTTLVPASIVTATVDNLLVQGGFLYYSKASNTYRANLDGTGAAVQVAATTIDYQLLGSVPVYITGGLVVYNGVTSTVAAVRLFQFGGVLFILDGLNRLMQLTITGNVVTVGQMVIDNVLAAGSANMVAGYLPVRTDQEVFAQSLIPDTVFAYPSNEVNEIMAYSCGIGFARKQSDQVKMGLLTAALAELKARFMNVNKRDEYQNYRINNDMPQGSFWL